MIGGLHIFINDSRIPVFFLLKNSESFVQNNLKEKLLKLASERSNIDKEINRLEPGKEEVTLF